MLYGTYNAYTYHIEYNIYIYIYKFVCIDAKGMKAGRIGFHRVCQRLMGFAELRAVWSLS